MQLCLNACQVRHAGVLPACVKKSASLGVHAMQADSEGAEARQARVSEPGQASQQQSGSATPASQEAAESSGQGHQGWAAEHPMEKNYTDTIESLLSELWKERLVSAQGELQRSSCSALWLFAAVTMLMHSLIDIFTG